MRRATLVLLLPFGCQAAPPPAASGSIEAVVKVDGRPRAGRPRKTREGAYVDERRLVGPDGGLANVVALVEVPGAPPWISRRPRMVFTDRFRPRVVFASPGGEVEIENGTLKDSYFISLPKRNPSRWFDVPAASSVGVSVVLPEFVPLDWT
jgi:hypothetical protein